MNSHPEVESPTESRRDVITSIIEMGRKRIGTAFKTFSVLEDPGEVEEKELPGHIDDVIRGLYAAAAYAGRANELIKDYIKTGNLDKGDVSKAVSLTPFEVNDLVSLRGHPLAFASTSDAEPWTPGMVLRGSKNRDLIGGFKEAVGKIRSHLQVLSERPMDMKVDNEGNKSSTFFDDITRLWQIVKVGMSLGEFVVLDPTSDGIDEFEEGRAIEQVVRLNRELQNYKPDDLKDTISLGDIKFPTWQTRPLEGEKLEEKHEEGERLPTFNEILDGLRELSLKELIDRSSSDYHGVYNRQSLPSDSEIESIRPELQGKLKGDLLAVCLLQLVGTKLAEYQDKYRKYFTVDAPEPPGFYYDERHYERKDFPHGEDINRDLARAAAGLIFHAVDPQSYIPVLDDRDETKYQLEDGPLAEYQILLDSLGLIVNYTEYLGYIHLNDSAQSELDCLFDSEQQLLENERTAAEDKGEYKTMQAVDEKKEVFPRLAEDLRCAMNFLSFWGLGRDKLPPTISWRYYEGVGEWPQSRHRYPAQNPRDYERDPRNEIAGWERKPYIDLVAETLRVMPLYKVMMPLLTKEDLYSFVRKSLLFRQHQAIEEFWGRVEAEETDRQMVREQVLKERFARGQGLFKLVFQRSRQEFVAYAETLPPEVKDQDTNWYYWLPRKKGDFPYVEQEVQDWGESTLTVCYPRDGRQQEIKVRSGNLVWCTSKIVKRKEGPSLKFALPIELANDYPLEE